jgi:hypothetical protein
VVSIALCVYLGNYDQSTVQEKVVQNELYDILKIMETGERVDFLKFRLTF